MKKLLLVFLVALFGSCNFSGREIITAEKPQIDNIQIATNSVSADLQIDIQSKRNIRLSATDLNISDQNGRKIGILRISDIKINRGTNKLMIPLKLYISTSPMRIISLLNGGDLKKLRVNGTIKVKSGLLGKRLRFENISVEDFLDGYLRQFAD